MTVELYLAFAAATTLLILVPGPNVALIVANSMAHGVRYGLATVAGTTTAMALQLTCVVLGLSGVLALFAASFDVLRWVGVAYLAWLGLKAWSAPGISLAAAPEAPRLDRIVARGFIVSLTNPKTLLFYAAFLPQFVGSEGDRTGQLLLLAATFIVIAAVLDSLWALAAHRARHALAVGGRVLHRITGGVLIAAAAGLAIARRP